jgi:hypothetical protein
MKLKMYIQHGLGCDIMCRNECCLLFYNFTRSRSDYIFSNEDFSNTERLRKAINFEIVAFSYTR